MSTLPVSAPTPNFETQRFWDATARGRIELPRCSRCGFIPFYPRLTCPQCQSTDLTWETMSGHGTVYSYTITRSAPSRAWREHVPFVLAYVQLEEGPMMMTNIVDCDPGDVRVDMAVTAVFDDTGEGSALIRFRPAS